jgi:hypothetical protein
MAQAVHPVYTTSIEEEDPVLAAFLNAPMDDRPETEEERSAVEAAGAAFLASGHARAHADVVASIERRRISG